MGDTFKRQNNSFMLTGNWKKNVEQDKYNKNFEAFKYLRHGPYYHWERNKLETTLLGFLGYP